LCNLNKHLPKDLDASVFVVMHVETESMLPEILNRCGKLPAAATAERDLKLLREILERIWYG